ncbi:TetR/AcrR family transcriptional regulator [Pseudonocardia asaccharolytica]|uniref:Hypothetical regulatory protein, TetR family n=1 Tax=Pseudonocardia asaccharolytica DSM 44247 = NBRC 16224 TaxID=1123024 RepID=A0A511CXW4_9PSEU|nr:TetR/AcrR family transcriptional regulator [Pseudonocardia asaccharolytica]GEL17419.1 hypothetical regulatory protein, TetR family [Pseudonocardia asaccharolytica DSM 44247 = NBRC 16224]
MQAAEPAHEDGRPPSRRERFRLATIDEIKEAARAQIAREGPAGLSVRAVARAMHMTPSALYRYFSGLDDLITALCVDAYHSLGDAARAAVDAEAPDDHVARWRAFENGTRRWALDNPGAFALIYGTPLPGYRAPAEVTRPAARRFTDIALHLIAAAVAAGAVDLDRALIQYRPRLDPGLTAGWEEADVPHDPRVLATLIGAWTMLQGHLTLELFGHFEWLETDLDTVFDAHVTATMLTIGFDPRAVAAAG